MAEILEGFLCPLCMKDLGDVIQLQIHFEETHSKEDQAFVQSLKDLFGKAKKKILNDENENLENLIVPKVQIQARNDDVHPVSGIRTDIYTGFSPAPASSNHFSQFKKIRSERVDRYAAETNRLIVRLDRLLDRMPAESSRRREHEQSVVQWVEEDLVKLCPNCAKSFNIARRKHHCRLCGSVMCKECSKFVEWDFCRKLINPSTLSIYSMKSKERQGWSVNGKTDTRSLSSLPKPSFGLRRTSSKESVQSMLSPGDKNAEEFRTCEYCLKLLKHRDAAIDRQTIKPIVTQFYERLWEYVEEGTTLSDQYLQMHQSFTAGETNYHLSDAKNLRMKLLKIAENVDLMSKKISVLGTDSENESFLSSRKYLLQTQIRRAAVNFIRETLVGLPSLPTEEQLVELQQKRKEEIARRVEEERRKAQEARIRFRNLQEKRQDTQKGKLTPSRSDQSIKYEKGFVLSSDRDELNASGSEDPMVQQMNIIRSYIIKAREANRFDEVSMLESNLRELQVEYKRTRDQEQKEAAAAAHHTQYESFNLHQSDSSENLEDRSAQYKPGSRTQNQSYRTAEQIQSLKPKVVQPTRRPSFTNNSAKPVLEEMARTVNSVREYLPNKSMLTSFNPFGTTGEDDYDASGKNPFSE